MAMTPEITGLLDARAVNQAAEAGIVPVAAIGNDGRRRVTSVGAADQAITVGSIDDKDTIDRGDDSIASTLIPALEKTMGTTTEKRNSSQTW